MMTNNISLSEESEINELEITKFNVEEDYDHDHDEDDDEENEELNIINLENKNKQKNYKIKLVSFLICLVILLLLLFLFAGGILQKSFGFLGLNNNNEYNGINIMDEIHIRSQLMRELRGNRTNEEECEARRCCDIRDGLSINQLPKDLNCSLLTDDECGDMDEFCEWDCDSSIHKSRKKGKFIRHFRKISGFPIQYQQPQTFNNNYNESGSTNNPYQQCLMAAKFITSDDCGIEYEEEIDPELAQALCEARDKYPEYFVSGSSGNGSLGDDALDSGEDTGDGPRRLTSFNPDNRIPITSMSYPASTVMFITYDDGLGAIRGCTGTMISKKWLLTAAHCLWGNGNFYWPIEVYKNVRQFGDASAANRIDIRWRSVFAEYQNARPYTTRPSAPDYDIGLIQLYDNPNLGHMGFGYDDSWSGSKAFNDYQYPGGYNLKGQSCIWNLFTTRFESSQCSQNPGASGGPIYRTDSGYEMIYGVHSAENQYYNSANRITFGTFGGLCSQIDIDEPDICSGLRTIMSGI